MAIQMTVDSCQKQGKPIKEEWHLESVEENQLSTENSLTGENILQNKSEIKTFLDEGKLLEYYSAM